MRNIFNSFSDKLVFTSRRSMIFITLSSLLLLFIIPALLYVWSKEIDKNIETQRLRTIKTISIFAHNSIKNIIARKVNGEISQEEAIQQISERLRSMIYQDEFGDNYVFLGKYDGTLLVQPFFPERENVNQWNLKDVRGKYIVREIIQVAQRSPEGDFYYYYYPSPYSKEEEEKISYVIGLPEVECFLGSGIYLRQSRLQTQALFQRVAFWSVIIGLLIILLYLVVIQSLRQHNKRLLQEIQQRQRVEKALKENEQRIMQALDSASHGIFDWDVTNYKVYLTPTWYTMLGYEPNNMPSTTTFLFSIIHPQDRENTEQIINTVFQPGCDDFSFEARMHRKDGEYQWMYVHGHVAERDETGEPLRVLGTHIDIHQRKLAELALAQNQARLNAIFETSSVGIALANLQGKFIHVNQRMLDMTGYTQQELLQLTNTDITYPEDIPVSKEKMRALLEGKISKYSIEKRYVRKDGSIFWVELHVSPIYSPNGSIEAFSGFVIDIHEQKLVQTALTKTETRFKKFFELPLVGAAITDAQQHWIEVNDKLCEMLGYSRKELLSLSWLDITPQEDKFNELAQIEKAGLNPQESFVNISKRYLRKDGQIIHARVSTYCVRQPDGSPDYYISLIEDITQQQLAEEALRASEQRFRELVQLLPLVVYETDREGRFTFVNQQGLELFGFPHNFDYTQKTALEMIVPADRERARQNLQRVIIQRIHSKTEYTCLRQDGSTFPAFLSSAPLIVQGETIGIRGILLDITERKAYERVLQESKEQLEERVKERTAQLQAALDELGAFSYSVSHDLRAPLRRIDGFAHILLEEYINQLPEEAQDLFQRIIVNINRMGQLIDDLLYLSRVTRAELRRTTVHLSELALNIFQQMSVQQPDRQVSFKVEPDLIAFADENLIQIVLENLISNALKYTSKQPHAIIEFGRTFQEGESVFYIKDNGVGFNMEYADKLFSVFQRLHSNQEFEGNGVGLATVQRIIVRHGGRVWAEGYPEKGATFYFTLPQYI